MLTVREKHFGICWETVRSSLMSIVEFCCLKMSIPDMTVIRRKRHLWGVYFLRRVLDMLKEPFSPVLAFLFSQTPKDEPRRKLQSLLSTKKNYSRSYPQKKKHESSSKEVEILKLPAENWQVNFVRVSVTGSGKMPVVVLHSCLWWWWWWRGRGCRRSEESVWSNDVNDDQEGKKKT